MFLVGVKKNCTTPFLGTQELHSRSTSNFCIFLKNFVRKFLLQRRRKFLSGAGLNNFLKAARYLGLVKCFKFLIKIFRDFFSILILSSITLKHGSFTDNLDFKGKAMINLS